MVEGNVIAALATPVGRGAVSIIRMSGDGAKEIISRCFSRADRLEHARMVLGTFDAGEIKDRVLVVLFESPHSYTGETLVEVHCHGSPEIASRILRRLIALGARGAEAGEFTRRAFLNGKLGLDEAEAVGELINARSAAAVNAALDNVTGRLHRETEGIYNDILGVISGYDAAIDYPEEDVEEQTAAQALPVLENAAARLHAIIRSYSQGEKLRDGVRVAIVGLPNAGKSSLLNKLLGRERAIVTANAGTTRDTIEESYEYKGMLFTLVDTAGIRETSDEAERVGVERSALAAQCAHIVLRVTDNSSPVFLPVETTGKIIEVYNKTDISDDPVPEGAVGISALTGDGVEELKEAVYAAALDGGVSADGIVITSARHYTLALAAAEALEAGINCLKTGGAPDLALGELGCALAHLGGITGANATEDVLDDIFSRFCVGK